MLSSSPSIDQGVVIFRELESKYGYNPNLFISCNKWRHYIIIDVLKSSMIRYLPEIPRDTLQSSIHLIFRRRITCDQYIQLTQKVGSSEVHKVSLNCQLKSRSEEKKPVAMRIETGSIDINAQDCCQNTKLSLATYFKNDNLINALLCKKANPDIPNGIGLTPLHIAVIENHPVSTLLLFYYHGADLNCRDITNSSPLHYACALGQEDHVEMLITSGADIDPTNNFHQTPLQLAVKYQHSEIVKRLIDAGADINYQGHDIMALLSAAFNRDLECVEILICAGAAKQMDPEYVENWIMEGGSRAFIEERSLPRLLNSLKRNIEETTVQEYKEKCEKILNYLTDETINFQSRPSPPSAHSLQSHCRRSIRKALSSSPRNLLFTDKVKELKLPVTIENYVAGFIPSSSGEQHAHS